MAFIAQLALRKPLARAAMRELRITGSWSDPQVTPVKRSSAAEAGKEAGKQAGEEIGREGGGRENGTLTI